MLFIIVPWSKLWFCSTKWYGFETARQPVPVWSMLLAAWDLCPLWATRPATRDTLPYPCSSYLVNLCATCLKIAWPVSNKLPAVTPVRIMWFDKRWLWNSALSKLTHGSQECRNLHYLVISMGIRHALRSSFFTNKLVFAHLPNREQFWD
jgi:hypothetical protein